MLLLLSILLILTEAFYEAYGDKTISGSVEFINRALAAMFFLMFMIGVQNPVVVDIPLWKAVLGYLFLREAIFDYMYNWVANLDWWYIGKTKFRDKFYRWLFQKVPNNFILFTRFCVGFMGSGMLIKF
jgi:hypothetical protein